METKLILSSLIFNNKIYYEYLRALNIINENRMISSINRPEYNNILSSFYNTNDIFIISIINYIQSTYIINKNFKNRKLEFIKIIGENCEIGKKSKGTLIYEMHNMLNLKDFLPQSFCKKIIYFNIQNKEEYCFSEFEKNKWTLEDPLNIEINNYQKTTSKIILTNIFSDL